MVGKSGDGFISAPWDRHTGTEENIWESAFEAADLVSWLFERRYGNIYESVT